MTYSNLLPDSIQMNPIVNSNSLECGYDFVRINLPLVRTEPLLKGRSFSANDAPRSKNI